MHCSKSNGLALNLRHGFFAETRVCPLACAEVSSPPCCARVRGFRPSSTMSSSSSTSTLACPVCDDPFRGAGSPSEPRVYPCSHTVCGQCAEAAALAPVAYCSVCCAVVNGTGVLNAGLAEYAESCFQANEAAIDSNDLLPAAGSPGGPAPFRPTSYSDAMSSISVDGDGLDADQSAATSSKVASSAPPLGDEPAEDNTIHELRSSLAAVEARCDSAAESLTATADAVLSGIASLHSRTRESCEAYSSAIDELIASLTSQRNRLLAEAAQLCAQRVKSLDATHGEMVVAAAQLRTARDLARSAHRDPRASSMKLRRALDAAESMASLDRPFDDTGKLLVVEIITDAAPAQTAVEAMAFIRSSPVDPTHSLVSGPGLLKYVTGEETEVSVAQNVIFLTCEDFEDKPVLGLVPSDVSLSITATAGDDTPIGHATSITPTGPGEFRVTYVVTLESQPSLFLSVFVCGVCLTPQPWQPVFAYTGGSRLIRSIPITAPVKYGIAVNKDENIMITSSHSQHCLTVTSLPSGATLRTIGSRGIRPGQLFEPFKLSFGPTQDTVLVCEPSNDRVSEFNVSSGEHVRCLPCTGAQTIACSGTGESDGMIVIGKDPGGASGDCISVYWYGSGCLLRTFGPLGSSPGSIATRCEGIRISPDGKHVYACEDGIKRISMFTIKGEFVRHIGAGTVGFNHQDLDFTSNGDLIVACADLGSVCVFDRSSHKLTRRWGHKSGQTPRMAYPTALSVSNNHLYVMDRDASVHIFG